MRKLLQKVLALSLVLALCLSTTPVLAAETAAAIRLSKTEGTVTVTNSGDRSLSVRTNMRLYNGYHVSTSETSYAWIQMDSEKLNKLDEDSKAEIRKSGKLLEVLLNEGNLYFNVTEPLEDDESLNIRTSTMVVGIRGTCGWVKVLDQYNTEVYVLEGTVWCTITDPVSGQSKTTTLSGGETARFTVYRQEQDGERCAIIRDSYTEEDIDGFVLAELLGNDPLCDKIYQESGLDLRGLTEEQVQERLEADQAAAAEKVRRQEELEASKDHNVSIDPVWGGQNTGSGGGGGGGGGAASTASSVVRLTMPVTDTAIQQALDLPTTGQVIVSPSGVAAQDTLTIGIDMTVASGKTLTLENGVPVNVTGNLTVDGTADLGDNLTNNGSITVRSANTLRVGRDVTNNGQFTVTATGRAITEGRFDTTGGTVSLTQGGRVMAHGFVPESASGWRVAVQQVDGYKILELFTPQKSTITLQSNNGGETTTVVTGDDGKLTAVPDPPADSNGRTFLGWYTEDGTTDESKKVTTDTEFDEDTTIYAVWSRDAGNFKIIGGTYDTDYSFARDAESGLGTLTILTAEPITISMAEGVTQTTTDHIFVADGVSANITLDGVDIAVSSPGAAAFEIAENSEGNVSITLAKGSKNTLASLGGNFGLYKKDDDPEAGMLTIDGTGMLTLEVKENGVGIGGREGSGGQGSGGRITVSDGTTIRCNCPEIIQNMYGWVSRQGEGGYYYLVRNTGDFAVEGGTYGVDYSFARNEEGLGVLTISGETRLTISMAEGVPKTDRDRISIAKDVSANITLNGVDIDMSGTGSVGHVTNGFPAMEIQEGGSGQVTVTLAAGSINSLSGGYDSAGLQANASDTGSGSLTITGTGQLTAFGGYWIPQILILGGAGIGAAPDCACIDITIEGGDITATGGDGDVGCDIGGYGGRIKITGGSIAVFDYSSEEPGSGVIGCKDFTMTGGEVDGGVEVSDSTFSITGGTFSMSGGTLTGGVDIGSDGTFTKTGGDIRTTDRSKPTPGGWKWEDTQRDGVYYYLVPNTDTGDFVVTGGAAGTDYIYADNTLTIRSDKEMAISMKALDTPTTTDRIFVANGVNADITLNGVNIDLSDGNQSALEIAPDSPGNVTITLADGSENHLLAGGTGAGLEKGGSGSTVGTLTIRGNGSLEAVGHGAYLGGINDYSRGGAGIGGAWGDSTRNIVIEGGNITAAVSRYPVAPGSAGIGGGRGGSGSNITITGTANVTAIGGDEGAGIGGGGDGGMGNDITISGNAQVVATGGSRAAGIGGGGDGGCGDITISGATVIATGNDGGAGIGNGVSVNDHITGTIKLSDSAVVEVTRSQYSYSYSACIGTGVIANGEGGFSNGMYAETSGWNAVVINHYVNATDGATDGVYVYGGVTITEPLEIGNAKISMDSTGEEEPFPSVYLRMKSPDLLTRDGVPIDFSIREVLETVMPVYSPAGARIEPRYRPSNEEDEYYYLYYRHTMG